MDERTRVEIERKLAQAQLATAEIPNGFPVQIVTAAAGTTNTMTLRAVDSNASFEASTWVAPEGYTKMDIPFRR